MSEEMESFNIDGESFNGFYLGSVNDAWDPVKQEARDIFFVYELYVDDVNRYHVVKKTGKEVVTHLIFSNWAFLEKSVKGSSAEGLLKLFGLQRILLGNK